MIGILKKYELNCQNNNKDETHKDKVKQIKKAVSNFNSRQPPHALIYTLSGHIYYFAA